MPSKNSWGRGARFPTFDLYFEVAKAGAKASPRCVPRDVEDVLEKSDDSRRVEGRLVRVGGGDGDVTDRCLISIPRLVDILGPSSLGYAGGVME